MHTAQVSVPGSDPPVPRQVTFMEAPAESPPKRVDACRTHSAPDSSYLLQNEAVDEPTRREPRLVTDASTTKGSSTSTTEGVVVTLPGRTARSMPMTPVAGRRS